LTLTLLLNGWRVRYDLNKADGVLFDSFFSRKQALNNGVKISRSAISSYGISENERINRFKNRAIPICVKIIYISAFFPYKNQLEVLKGMLILKLMRINFTIDLVGN
jgi:hypothetical protein